LGLIRFVIDDVKIAGVKLPGGRRGVFGLDPDSEGLAICAALATGLLMGCVTALFRYCIVASHDLFQRASDGNIPGFEAGPSSSVLVLFRILTPGLGGLVVGLIVYKLLRMHGGHGVVAILKCLAAGQTNLPPKIALRSATSILTITSGGSAGPEGPITEIGSVVGSIAGQAAGLSRDRLVTLIGCGAAAGIAGVFNAPIGGVFFALELILSNFAVGSFASIVIAAVTASVVSTALLPNHAPFMHVPMAGDVSLTSPIALLEFCLLGVLCGLVGTALISGLTRSQEFFQRLRMPIWLKPAVGGVGVGMIGLLFPGIMGEGYEFINDAILGANDAGIVTLPLFGFFIAAVAAKLLMTCVTLGSGGSGGAFAPSMVIGGLLGAAFGIGLRLTGVPETPSVAVMALVGMASCVASVLHAPIACTLIIYEVSGANYVLLLPTMLAVACASLIAKRIGTGSIYTLPLLREGLSLAVHERRSYDPLVASTVGEIMRTTFARMEATASVDSMLEVFSETKDEAFVVVDGGGLLLGVVSAGQLRELFPHRELGALVIASEVADRQVQVLYRGSPATEARRIFSHSDAVAIPVLESVESPLVVGLVDRTDVLEAYAEY